MFTSHWLRTDKMNENVRLLLNWANFSLLVTNLSTCCVVVSANDSSFMLFSNIFLKMEPCFALVNRLDRLVPDGEVSKLK